MAAAINTYTGKKLEPLYPGAETIPIKLDVSLTLARGTILGEKIGTDEIVTVSITGVPTGGTFTLTFGAQTTSAIPYGANSQTIQQALEALSTIGDGNVKVTADWNNVGAEIVIVFIGALGSTNVGAVTSSVASLTGGTPAVAVAVTRAGAAGTSGTWKAYDNDNTDGSEEAKLILGYDVVVDAAGLITLGTSEAPDASLKELTVPAYRKGVFKTADLVGLDEVAVAQLGRLIQGTVASGILQMS